MVLNKQHNAGARFSSNNMLDASQLISSSIGTVSQQHCIYEDITSPNRTRLFEIAEGAKNRFKSVIKKLYEWELVDGDAFLKSKEWPYLWKK
jgi:hypothetical protein